MKKSLPAAATPDEYLARLSGWQKDLVQLLRSTGISAAKTEEGIKWGHLVYHADGPLFLIRAEEQRVLFGFWRGQRLREIEPRLKPGGKYEMATMELREGDALAKTLVRRLVKAAVALNQELGDPTRLPEAGEKAVKRGKGA